jgi:hypothetical protein
MNLSVLDRECNVWPEFCSEFTQMFMMKTAAA